MTQRKVTPPGSQPGFSAGQTGQAAGQPATEAQQNGNGSVLRTILIAGAAAAAGGLAVRLIDRYFFEPQKEEQLQQQLGALRGQLEQQRQLLAQHQRVLTQQAPAPQQALVAAPAVRAPAPRRLQISDDEIDLWRRLGEGY